MNTGSAERSSWLAYNISTFLAKELLMGTPRRVTAAQVKELRRQLASRSVATDSGDEGEHGS